MTGIVRTILWRACGLTLDNLHRAQQEQRRWQEYGIENVRLYITLPLAQQLRLLGPVVCVSPPICHAEPDRVGTMLGIPLYLHSLGLEDEMMLVAVT